MQEYQEYFCDEFNTTLSCFHDMIMGCCSNNIGPIYYKEYKGQKIDWDKFRKIKQDAFKLLNTKDISKSPCENCFFLRKKKPSDVVYKQFKKINISHWTQCNCGCIYCARMYSSKGKITLKPEKSEYYDMLPLLKSLYKQDLLDRDNLEVCIQGGDISVLPEFPDIVQECLDNGLKQFSILTNNIKYQPIIKKLLDLHKGTLITSLDCADKETFFKIKRVDKFDATINNLKRYAKTNNLESIIVRYIIIEHINDSEKMIKDFVNLIEDIGLKKIDFTIDNKYALSPDFNIEKLPKHYKNLYLLINDICKEKNIELIMLTPQVQNIVNKYLLVK